MSSDCRIRRATEADVEEVTDLFVSYLEFYRRGCEPSSAKNFICERLAKGDSEIFLATTSSGAVAFVQLYPAFSSLSMKRIWILNDMYVHPRLENRVLEERCLRGLGSLPLKPGLLT